jgi:hypothetical protein
MKKRGREVRGKKIEALFGINKKEEKVVEKPKPSSNAGFIAKHFHSLVVDHNGQNGRYKLSVITPNFKEAIPFCYLEIDPTSFQLFMNLWNSQTLQKKNKDLKYDIQQDPLSYIKFGYLTLANESDSEYKVASENFFKAYNIKSEQDFQAWVSNFSGGGKTFHIGVVEFKANRYHPLLQTANVKKLVKTAYSSLIKASHELNSDEKAKAFAKRALIRKKAIDLTSNNNKNYKLFSICFFSTSSNKPMRVVARFGVSPNFYKDAPSKDINEDDFINSRSKVDLNYGNITVWIPSIANQKKEELLKNINPKNTKKIIEAYEQARKAGYRSIKLKNVFWIMVNGEIIDFRTTKSNNLDENLTPENINSDLKYRQVSSDGKDEQKEESISDAKIKVKQLLGDNIDEDIVNQIEPEAPKKQVSDPNFDNPFIEALDSKKKKTEKKANIKKKIQKKS